MLILAEKKLVGKTVVVNLDAIKGLVKSDKEPKKNGKDVSEDKSEQPNSSTQLSNDDDPKA